MAKTLGEVPYVICTSAGKIGYVVRAYIVGKIDLPHVRPVRFSDTLVLEALDLPSWLSIRTISTFLG